MGLLDGVRSFFNRPTPEDAAMKMAAEYVVTLGLFDTQLSGIPESDDDIISQSARFSQAMIPFLGTRQDAWMHELLDRFLQNYEMYLKYKQISQTLAGLAQNRALITILSMKDMLVSEGKIILSLTYQRIEYKTIVLNKGFLPPMGGGGIIPGSSQVPQLPPPLKGFSGRLPE